MLTRRPLTIVLVAALVLLASACTVTFLPPLDSGGAATVDRPRPPTGESTSTVDRPRPPVPSPLLPSDEGFRVFEIAPRNIFPGSQMYFRVSVRRSGFLTISAMDPEQRVHVLIRDFPIQAGGSPVLVPPIGNRESVEGRAPEGTWRLRASWSPGRLDARYDGLRGLDAWTGAIRADLARFDDASVFDDTYEVLRR
ncbi:MAG: DUF4384 domain-containing protein [Trueperaceae bacterium]|nr:DUF4384 domain-containing protein [Trueperaceae bacterium]